MFDSVEFRFYFTGDHRKNINKDINKGSTSWYDNLKIEKNNPKICSFHRWKEQFCSFHCCYFTAEMSYFIIRYKRNKTLLSFKFGFFFRMGKKYQYLARGMGPTMCLVWQIKMNPNIYSFILSNYLLILIFLHFLNKSK